MHDEMTAFCTDNQLVELIELSKSRTDLLELLNPRENQHSDLLAWCFNSREGHGQSDSIFKDFLLAIFHAATDKVAGDKLHGKGLTREFVKVWTPARILTSSFATAVFFREYSLPNSVGGTGKSRLDLVIIDADNEFIVVVENKAGARLTGEQLERYLEGVQRILLSKPAFTGFKVAFVALDRNHDPFAEEAPKDHDGRWAILDYEWLEPGAKRAELSLNRGNQDAGLILSYCRKQTGWESEGTKRINKLSRELAIAHPSVVRALSDVRRKLKDPAKWTPSHLRQESAEGQLLRLLMQNGEACVALMDLPVVELLHGHLCEQIPHLDDEEYYDKARVRVAYRPRVEIPTTDDYWPLFVAVRHVNSERQSAVPNFRISLVWRPQFVAERHRAKMLELVRSAFHDAKRVSMKATMLEQVEVSSIRQADLEVRRMLSSCEKLPLPVER